MRVLYVCTANICRSASAAALLGDAGLPQVQVRSAGTAAVSGSPGCSVAPALTTRFEQHTSQQVTRELVEWADLVLTAARRHRQPVVDLDPSARERTFTIRQAGRLARWLVDAGMVQAARDRAADAQTWGDRFDEGDPRRYVSALQEGDTTTWVIAELDAARGMVPTPEVEEPPRRRWWQRSEPPPPEEHPDDVPDPHELGLGWHDPAYAQIQEATESLVALLREAGG